jgi:peptidoglycan/xylan/chitin deacetylase (PgdA/CDA1 family)
MVCFDFEAGWGMPGAGEYDLAAATEKLLARLASFRVRAVFFVVGELALAHPEIIRAIAAGRHEVALHGYRHEAFIELSDAQFAEAAEGIDKAARAIEALIGQRPIGFRAPYLLSPRFTDARLEAALHNQGFRWISHCEIHQPVVHARPLGRPTRLLFGALRIWPDVLEGLPGATLTAIRNWRLIIRRAPLGSRARTLRWMLAGSPPYDHAGLVEIPVTGPLDTTVLGLPGPGRDSPAAELEFGAFAMRCGLSARGGIAMLTFHDWLITGANRIVLLERMLAAIDGLGLQSVRGVDVLSDRGDGWRPDRAFSPR